MHSPKGCALALLLGDQSRVFIESQIRKTPAFVNWHKRYQSNQKKWKEAFLLSYLTKEIVFAASETNVLRICDRSRKIDSSFEEMYSADTRRQALDPHNIPYLSMWDAG